MKKDRRSFLTQVCPTVAFAFFGLSFLEACSKIVPQSQKGLTQVKVIPVTMVIVSTEIR